MARIDPSGRIRLDKTSMAIVHGWAVLVQGKISADLLFTRLGQAQTYAELNHIPNSEIIAVVVTGEFIERV